MPPHRHAYRPTVMGARGVVTSAHPLASMAGIQMLQAGGNAVDAAVAVGSTLNVVEPFMSSAGGIGLMLISRGHERHVLDFIGKAPAAADAAACTDDELAGGPKSCATPGNLGGWLAALERFGSMDRARVLSPAISLAEHGVPLTFKSVEFIEGARQTLGRSAEAQRLYLGNGGPRPRRNGVSRPRSRIAITRCSRCRRRSPRFRCSRRSTSSRATTSRASVTTRSIISTI